MFELQKGEKNPEKVNEKIYLMVIFSKTLSETIAIENPKTLKLGMSLKNFFY